MSNYFWLIDAGHGGIDNSGRYVTAPSKMFKFEDNYTIYEGHVNRLIQDLVCERLEKEGVQYMKVNHPIIDTPLHERVSICNTAYKKNRNSILISIHSNAGKGSGNEVYTSLGQTKSDIVAAFFADSYVKNFSSMVLRKDLSDGDLDKEENFFILRNTLCPSVLLENGFMDNRKEAEFLNSLKGQQDYCNCIIEAILRIEKTIPV